MAHSLSLKVVAEGVETESTTMPVPSRVAGCHLMQGTDFTRPKSG